MDENLLTMIVEGILVLLSLGVSAFFSGSEVALNSITPMRISQIAGKDVEGHPLASWLRNPSKYLTTLLVGNNICNIGGAVIAGDFFRRLVGLWISEDGVAEALPGTLAFLTMTFLILVFGEILPKIYCRHHHERIAPRVMGPLNLLYRVLKYPIRFLMWIANTLIRLFGGEPSAEDVFVTADDLKTLIEVGQEQGLLEEGEREMLHSIFELSETPVREVMTPRVDMVYVEISDTLDQVLKAFEQRDFSRLPVIENTTDNVVGILYMKDLLHRWRNEKNNGDVVRALMRPPLFVPENKRIDDVLEQFQREKTHIAIVVDEYGGTEGLVTIEDILEEIVGEIEDEFDEERETIVRVSDEAWIVEASVDLDDLEDELGVEWSENVEYESLAGLLLESHGDLPKVDDVVEYGGFRFTILEADERKIAKVRIDKISAESAPELEVQEI